VAQSFVDLWQRQAVRAYRGHQRCRWSGHGTMLARSRQKTTNFLALPRDLLRQSKLP
jgi:hypothetical protein